MSDTLLVEDNSPIFLYDFVVFISSSKVACAYAKLYRRQLIESAL